MRAMFLGWFTALLLFYGTSRLMFIGNNIGRQK